MTIKDDFIKSFSNKKDLTNLRYYWAKIAFIINTLVFFSIFYLIWNWLYTEFLKRIISPVYILLLISLNLYIFFLCRRIFFEKKYFSYIISGISIIVSIFFILKIII